MKCRDEVCGVGMQAAEQAEFSSIDCWHPGQSKCKLHKENYEHVWLITVSLIKHTQKRDDSRGANHEMKTSVWKHDDRVGDKEANFTLRYDLGGKFYFVYFFSWTSNCWLNHFHPQWKETRGFSFKVNNKVMKRWSTIQLVSWTWFSKWRNWCCRAFP